MPIWSEWIIGETWRVLAWRWLTDANREDSTIWDTLTSSANEMMRYLIPVMTLVTLRDHVGIPPWSELMDPDDIPVWDTAIAGGASFVVSHNIRDFPQLVDGRHLHRGVEYLTAIEFIEDVLGEDASALFGGVIPAGGLIRSRRTR